MQKCFIGEYTTFNTKMEIYKKREAFLFVKLRALLMAL